MERSKEEQLIDIIKGIRGVIGVAENPECEGHWLPVLGGFMMHHQGNGVDDHILWCEGCKDFHFAHGATSSEKPEVRACHCPRTISNGSIYLIQTGRYITRGELLKIRQQMRSQSEYKLLDFGKWGDNNSQKLR